MSTRFVVSQENPCQRFTSRCYLFTTITSILRFQRTSQNSLILRITSVPWKRCSLTPNPTPYTFVWWARMAVNHPVDVADDVPVSDNNNRATGNWNIDSSRCWDWNRMIVHRNNNRMVNSILDVLDDGILAFGQRLLQLQLLLTTHFRCVYRTPLNSIDRQVVLPGLQW